MQKREGWAGQFFAELCFLNVKMAENRVTKGLGPVY